MWQFGFSEDRTWDDESIVSSNFDDCMPVPSAFDAMPLYNGKRGVGLYRRTVAVPPGSNARLVFNAVGMYAKVFVDGEKVCEQYAAYTPFHVDMVSSEHRDRDVVVMVGNRFDRELYPLHEIFFDFYAYGGIFRDVELQVFREGPRVDWVGVDTLDYRTGAVQVGIEPAELGQTFAIAIDDSSAREFTVDELSGGRFVVPLTVEGATPWSPDHPELHTVTVATQSDSLEVTFGVRQVSTAEGKILLNGTPVKLLGYCRHEAHPQYGPALPLVQLVADLQLLRDSGCNFVRGSHYQQDPRFLDLCDEMGMLVFEESLGWGPREEHMTNPAFVDAQLKQTADMIRTSYNHPSVIMRGFLNEGVSNMEASRPCYESLIRLVREKDPHRLVTYASNRYLNDLFLEQIDVINFNMYPAWYSPNHDDECPLDEIRKRIHENLEGLELRGLADKPYIISEIGAGAIYGWRDPICAHWSEEYQREVLKIVSNEVVTNPRIAGVSLWQFFDCRTYRGAGALGRPRAFNNKGVMDEYRRPKQGYEAVKAIFNAFGQKEA